MSFGACGNFRREAAAIYATSYTAQVPCNKIVRWSSSPSSPNNNPLTLFQTVVALTFVLFVFFFFLITLTQLGRVSQNIDFSREDF